MSRVPDNEAFARHAQERLKKSGDYTGQIDGWAGPMTRRALNKALERAGRDASVPATPARPVVRFVGPKQTPEEMTRVYGPPGGVKCTAGRVELPLTFRFVVEQPFLRDWYLCHELLAPAMTSMWRHVFEHYGGAEMERLGLAEFGGCFAYRQMRNSTGSRLSTHAWGAAIDVDPAHNQLAWGSDKARLAGVEYDAFWRIVAEHGGVSLGKSRNFDWMHIQWAQL